MKADESKTERDVKALFDRVRQLPVSADPYLETRILAALRERRRGPAIARWWKRLALTTSAIAGLAAVALVVVLTRPAGYTAFRSEPFVVKIEVAPVERQAIAKMRIALPEGVSFAIEGFPELHDRRELTLRWKAEYGQAPFPFVLMAEEAGDKTVVIQFYDERDALISERKLSIRVKGRTPGEDV